MSIKEKVRSALPNWFWLHSALSKQKIRQYYRYRISEQDIQNAESNWNYKRSLVDRLSKEWLGYTKAVDKEIDLVLARAPEYQSRDDLELIRCDMRFCRYAYGFQPDEYLCFHLEGKKPDEKRAFVSDMDRNKYVCQMNDIVDFTLFMDKYRTYERFKELYCRDAVSVRDRCDRDEFLQFVSKHPVFVLKRTDLSKGDSVEKIDATCMNSEQLDVIFDGMCGDGSYIAEELVNQSSLMSKLNTSSVNTIRCITFNTEDGIIAPYCFLKVGRAGSFVDNGGAGGLLVGIDVSNGMLSTNAFDEYGQEYQVHPDSKMRFKGYQLPEWQSMLEICRNASERIPSVGYIGWDMAHTDDGWIVIEGNAGSQMIGPQIVWQCGIKNEVEQLMSKMRLYA